MLYDTTYKIAIIPRRSAAGGLCRGGWLQCCGNACARLCPAGGVVVSCNKKAAGVRLCGYLLTM